MTETRNDGPVQAEYVTCDHHWVSHLQGDFPPGVHIEQCSMCGHFNGPALAEFFPPAASVAGQD